MDIIRKQISLELKEEKEGSFLARIATLDAIDKDLDVTTPGAFDTKEVLISAYQHSSWHGELPVGKATISEKGGEVLAEGQFNLDSVTGKEHYEAGKFSIGLQEWSYGFKILEEGSDEEINAWAKAHDGARPARIIKKVDVIEISPVLVGAGINTELIAIKSEGMTYADQAEAVLTAVKDLVGRTESLADLRRKEGRVLSTDNRERLAQLQEALTGVSGNVKVLLDAAEPVDKDAVQALYLRYVQLKTTMEEI